MVKNPSPVRSRICNLHLHTLQAAEGSLPEVVLELEHRGMFG